MSFIIELENITKEYTPAPGVVQKVLKGISFKIKKGEFLSIIGPSGSGKSTLMNIIGCLDQPTSGSYLLSGRDVSRIKKDELAYIRGRTLGFVFQNFNLLSKRNLIDNIALPLLYAGLKPKEREKRALNLIEKVKLKGYEKYFPPQLSGGMKQRVAIARALINNPDIILADEPTGNLDTKTSFEILNLFKEFNKTMNITVIMITHERDIAAMTERSIKIIDGLVEYDGVPES
jgi:putative ABC transport system ATP-binding protein